MMSIDITDLKRQCDELESKLEQVDLPLRHILSHIPVHVYWKNKEGVYLGCNDSQARTLGFSYGKDVVGKTDFELLWGSRELVKSYRENDLRIMETGLCETMEEAAFIGGKEVIFLSFKSPLRNKKGEVVGVLGISIDINKQKEIEKHLIEATRIAEAANRAKTEFLENMRHDFRTPLSGIIGLTELLNENTDKRKISLYKKGLIESSKELLRFFNEVLESINVSSGNIPLLKKPFELKEILENVIKLHKSVALEKQLDLRLHLDEKIPKNLIGDSTRIYRIILELLTNALKFTEVGQVDILAKLGKKEGKNVVVQIFVEDTGIGFPEEKKSDLFMRFKRLTPSYQGIYKGSGLGLSIVKQFIDDLQGEIYVESRLNVGTKFVCVIPLQEPWLEDPFKDSSIVSRQKNITPISNYQTIRKKPIEKYGLIVEDHPIAAFAEQELLMATGCRVDVVNTGKEALEKIQMHQYDFILMDIGLPDINGYELAKHMRLLEGSAQHQNLIIGLTGHLDPEKQKTGLDAGMDMIVSKPLTEDLIYRLLANANP